MTTQVSWCQKKILLLDFIVQGKITRGRHWPSRLMISGMYNLNSVSLLQLHLSYSDVTKWNASLTVAGASPLKRSVYEQHHEWATLGFIRAIASSRTISRCLIDKRWLHTLLNVINVPTAAASTDDKDDDAHTAQAHSCSLPKRVCSYLLIN